MNYIIVQFKYYITVFALIDAHPLINAHPRFSALENSRYIKEIPDLLSFTGWITLISC